MPPLPCVSTAAHLFSPTTTTTTASTRRLRLGGVQDVFAHHFPVSLCKHICGERWRSKPRRQTPIMFRCTGKHFRCELSDWTDRRRPLLWNICGKCWVLLAADYYVKGMVKKSGSRYMRQCEATVVCRDANNAVHTIHDTDFNTSSNVVLMLCCPLFFPFFPFFPHKDLNWNSVFLWDWLL